MDIVGVRTTGLGDTTYLAVHEGLAVVIDPQRDIDRFLAAADELGAEIGFVFETHVHNDYVSGGRALAAAAGAQLALPAAAGAAFDHFPAFHLEDIDLGAFSVRPLHTPGHTPEHVSYLVMIDGRPEALFSGGSLLVGSAGRTDLLGPELARQLARLQFGSVQRLGALPGELGLYPTHGEGSFCSVTTAGRDTSTIAQERVDNPVLHFNDAEAFADAQLSGLQPYPAYYAHMAPLNRVGPAWRRASPPELAADEIPDGTAVVDVRPRELFAAGHLEGSIGIPDSDSVATWAGWLLPFNAPVALVATPTQDVAEIVRQFERIGFDDIRGVVRDLSGSKLIGYRQATGDELATALASDDPPTVLDVRAPAEWDAGHLPGAVWRYVPDILDGVDLPAGTQPWVVCQTGFRATVAAGLLERHGIEPVVVGEGGMATLSR